MNADTLQNVNSVKFWALIKIFCQFDYRIYFGFKQRQSIFLHKNYKGHWKMSSLQNLSKLLFFW